MRYTRLTALLVGIGLALALSTPALAEHDRRGGYHQNFHHHYHGQHYKGDRFHRSPRHGGWHRRHHRPSRIIEKHVIIHEEPRYLAPRRHRHHSTSVPLVTVGGVPIVTIRSDY
ncbi:hypothetical protein GCM10007160_28710 [Litchfieldella qijiaojingensis]|uniref:Uncharacterized protein n=1 Tax=Litchfieldella qijiaojingensis TaxID=980347 RepID=A0ABQ2YYB1_9GAMM|nr:hypothetical protein [Halomonas qijiaojingensis]GGX99330.1 hypothetical protein GCM10007160_28710 [Halomonas qijiaojingensis]